MFRHTYSKGFTAVAVDTAPADSFGIEDLRSYYQIISDLRTGTACGFESLMRRIQPDGTPTRNAAFSRELDSEDWPDVGLFLLEQDCNFARKINSGNQQPLFVSFNAVPELLSKPDFAETMAKLLQQSGAKASQIKIEIMECDYAQYPGEYEQVLANLIKLKVAGHSIVMDDFPTKFSNPARLDELVRMGLVTGVKLDHVVLDMEPQQRAELVKVLDKYPHLERIVEGVETIAHAEIACGMGSPLVQGFLVQEALSPEDALELVGNDPNGQTLEHDRVA